MGITITEALAEIKTISKRLEKKREASFAFVARQEGIRDPLEKDGGSEAYIARERQGIKDLNTRLITLRRGIQRANDTTTISIGSTERTISEWLTWRRECSAGEQAYLTKLRHTISGVRDSAKRGGSLAGPPGTVEKPTDWIININEQQLAKEIEHLEEVLGTLDGQLSLKNATTAIEE